MGRQHHKTGVEKRIEFFGTTIGKQVFPLAFMSAPKLALAAHRCRIVPANIR